MEDPLNTRVRRRSEELTSGDWTPFVNNIEDILSETTGMIKNLRKILIKLEVIDDRFIF
jgi:chromosome condensin MukBEF complex kleisin-like MukF subunit